MVLEEYLKNNFDVEHKNPSEEALRRWRSAVSIVLNPRRRFRHVADLVKRAEADKKKRKFQVPFPLLRSVHLQIWVQFLSFAALFAVCFPCSSIELKLIMTGKCESSIWLVLPFHIQPNYYSF